MPFLPPNQQRQSTEGTIGLQLNISIMSLKKPQPHRQSVQHKNTKKHKTLKATAQNDLFGPMFVQLELY